MRIRGAETAAKPRKQRVPDEVRSGADDMPVTREQRPRSLVRRVDAHFAHETRRRVAQWLDAQRPCHLDPTGFGEVRKRGRTVDVLERDVELPDLANRADREFMRRRLTEELEARMICRRAEVVDAKVYWLGGAQADS